jgi:hypothetical protein
MAFASAGPMKWSELNCAYGFGSNATFSYSNVRASTEGASFSNISLSNIQNRPVPYAGFFVNRKFTETATATFNNSTEAQARFNNTKGTITYVDNINPVTEVNVCYEWIGFMKLTENGSHTFNINTDDGGQLEVNGTIVSTYYGSHGMGGGGVSGSLTLNAGVYPIRLLLQQGGGGLGAQILYRSPSSATFTTIQTSLPAQQFCYGFKPYVKLDANHLAFRQGITANSAIATWSNMGTDGTAVHATGASANSQGNPTLTQDDNGFMVTFDRTKQQHFTLGSLTFDKFRSADNLNINGLCVLCVARFQPGNRGNWERIFDFGNGASSDNILLARSDTSSSLVLTSRNGSPETVGRTYTFAQMDGAFHVYGLVITNSATSTMTFSVDGNEVTDGAVNRVTPTNILNRTTTINYIGRSLFGGSDAYFTGDVRELQIYREAIPTAMMLQMSRYLMLKWGVRSDVSFITNGLVGYFTGESWTGSVWNDISPSLNNTNAIRGTPVNNSVTLNGFRCLSGGTAAGLRFPAGMLPSGYTLFHVARYNGASKQRIFDGYVGNFLSGFHMGRSGLAYHETWITPETNVHGDNWVLSVDQKDLYKSNGVQRSTITGIMTAVSLSINHGSYVNTETSDWTVACVIAYNRTLNSTEIQQMELYLNRKYRIY